METAWMKRTSARAVALLLLAAPFAAAQTADELAKQTQNPVASLISVPFQGNWDFGLGDRDATGTLLNVQPVMPFALTKSTNVILRVIMPLTSQPTSDGERISGLGPSVVALMQPGKWTVGLLANQIWSVSGANDRNDVETTFVQPFVNYNLGSGLAVGISMEASANWEADETWTAPLLFSVSKVTLLGKRPVSFVLAAGPTVASPDAGADWRFRLGATFLFPR